MKKLVFLFVLALGFMSFTTASVNNVEEVEQGYVTCCTATVTYNGEYHSSYTSCVDGIGPETSALACSLAKGKAQAFINAQ